MKVPDIIDLLERIYSRHAELGMRGCYQFSFIDQPEGAAEFQVNVGDTATVQPGRAAHADLTIEMRYEHLEGSVVGQVDLPQKLLHAEISARGRLTMLYQLGALVESLRSGEAPNPALAEKKSYKLRYPSVPRPCEVRSAARAPILEIERRRDVSLDEFHSRYVAQGIPIIMEGAASHWPLAQMNLEAARSFLGNLHGYALEAGYEDQVFEGSVNVRVAPMADFADGFGMLGVTTEDRATPYMANNPLPTEFLPLIETPPHFAADAFIPTILWMGPAGTLTPIHRDATSSLFCQVWGSKAMLLAAPHYREELYTWSTTPEGGLETCDVDPDNPDYERFPRLRDVRFSRVEFNPGDIFYMPQGWFHHTWSLTPALSISFFLRQG